MEQSQTSAFYNSGREITRFSDLSFSNQQSMLNDNYSLEEIVKLKMRDIARTVVDLSELYERESTLPPERTCVEFATFVKEKSNYISSLNNILQETEPFGYPKYRAEAFIKVKENLEVLIQDLKLSEKSLNGQQRALNSRCRSSLNRCAMLQEVMNKSTNEKSTADVKNAISVKLSEEKMNNSRNDLKYVLENVFPDYKQMKTILSALVEASEQINAAKRWITITNEMDYSCVLFLIQAGLVKKHTQDKTKITLVQTGS